MLISSSRHTLADIEYWRQMEMLDRHRFPPARLSKFADLAMDEIQRFLVSGPAYSSTSWGKDSTVLSHIMWRLQTERGVTVPTVWVRVEPIKNPECLLVRDRFLEMYPIEYREIEIHCLHDADGWHASGTLQAGFQQFIDETGVHRHISGVRGEESRVRGIRMARWGRSSVNTCAPLGYWKMNEIFSYLTVFDLPIHPVYAMSLGGQMRRRELRVCSLGCTPGDAVGRSEWEARYYPDIIRKLRL